MITLKPYPTDSFSCECGGSKVFSGHLWQGVHICEKYVCEKCSKTIIKSLPVNQATIQTLTYYPDDQKITDNDGNLIRDNWYSEKLRCIGTPVDKVIDVDIEIIEKRDNILILNTLDFVYGHSLLFLLNLQRIIELNKGLGIVVILQPMLRWLVPRGKLSEIWTVNLGFDSFKNYYPDLSLKINSQLERFKTALLSKGHLIPTNENIRIEQFTGIKTFDFLNKPSKPRITFIWREDADRMWIRNIYILKGFKRLGIGKILLPFHFLRISRLLRLLKSRFGSGYNYSVAGLGTFGRFQAFIDDQRIESFNADSEIKLCKIYSESIVVIGIHGSSMLLPSAHAGMTVSLMPSKRWGNYLEDILFTENDLRHGSFQKRVIPLNISLNEIRDIVIDMIEGRDYFIKKFVHSNEL
jgi:hypothetical protein